MVQCSLFIATFSRFHASPNTYQWRSGMNPNQNNDIKERIESLRNKCFPKKSVPSQLHPSESSKDTIIDTLKQRNEKLDRENYALRSHLEIAYGLADPDLVAKVGELQKRIKDLEEENKKVKQDLKNAQDELEDLR